MNDGVNKPVVVYGVVNARSAKSSGAVMGHQHIKSHVASHWHETTTARGRFHVPLIRQGSGANVR